MPDVPAAETQSDNKKYIETAFGVICNTPMLCDHTVSWEILVSKRHISDSNDEDHLSEHIPVCFRFFFFFFFLFVQYNHCFMRVQCFFFSSLKKVLFRIHHSLGDGVALLRLFLETIADREQPKKDLWAHCVRVRQQLKQFLECDLPKKNAFEQKVSIWKSLKKFNLREMKRLWCRFQVVVRDLSQKLLMFLTSPASIVHQAFFQQIDENSLHKSKLTGEKVKKNIVFFLN